MNTLKLVEERPDVLYGQKVTIKVYDWVDGRGNRTGPPLQGYGTGPILYTQSDELRIAPKISNRKAALVHLLERPREKESNVGPLQAWCSSVDCQDEASRPALKASVPPKEIDCPDCGSALYWKRG